MRLFLPTAVALACSIGATTSPERVGPAPSATPCDPASLKRLLEPALFESFFHCVDSMRRVQYPEGDQDTTHSVDLPRSILPEFLNNLDYDELSAAGVAEMEFQFHIAPKGYADPPTCKDKVSVRFFPDRCYFRLVVSNNFLVPPNWCHGAQVVYGFTIGRDRVLDFYRDEAG